MDEERKFHSEKAYNDWWDEFMATSREAFCLTCWWHNFDDKEAKAHKAEFKDHRVKSKSGLDI